MLDLLIRGGMVIDGSGNPGFYGAVGVEGESVSVHRGDLSGIEAAREIDATGKVVCPGFIDMHAHSGLVILSEPMHEPKVRQGVTTELIGIDGNSYAPFHSHDDFLKFVEINSGLDGNPPLPGRWSTVAEYLSMFDNKVAVNIAYIIGNSPIRICAMGWNDRPCTPAELENQKALLREGMEEGAFGISTGPRLPAGQLRQHRRTGRTQRAGRAVGRHLPHPCAQQLGRPLPRPSARSHRHWPSQRHPFSHHPPLPASHTSPAGRTRYWGLVEAGRDEGLDVTFDSYPYTYSSTRILIIFPQWAHDGGPEKLKEVMRSPEGVSVCARRLAPVDSRGATCG